MSDHRRGILAQIRGSLRLSTTVIQSNPRLSTGQLVGRLKSSPTPGLGEILSRGVRAKTGTWLCPQTGSLDPPDGALLQTIRAHRGPISCLAMTSNLGISGSEDGTVRVWDLSGGRELAVLDHGGTEVVALAMSQDDGRVVTGCTDGRIRVWDVQTGARLREFVDEGQPVRALAVAPCGRWFASGSDDGIVRVWDLRTGTILQRVGRHTATISDIAITPDGRRVITCSEDQTIRAWHLSHGSESVLVGHQDTATGVDRAIRIVGLSPNSVGLSPDGRYAVSCADGDPRARLWNLDQAETMGSLRSDVSHDRVIFAQFSPDGRSLVGGSLLGFVHIWQFPSGELSRVLGGALFEQMETGGFRKLEETQGSSPSPLLRTGRESHQTELTAFALSPDGRKVLTGARAGDVKQWHLDSQTDEGPGRPNFGAFSIAVSSEAGQAVTDSEGSCGPWVISLQGDVLLRLEAPEGGGEVRALAVSPDSETVFAGMDDGSLWAWTNEAQLGGDGELLGLVGSHYAAINSLSVSEDGQFLLSSSEDETLKVWDRENGFQELAEFSGEAFTSAAITPDGQHVLSGLENGQILVWDIDEPWEEVETLRGHRGPVQILRIHPDGEDFTSVCSRGRVMKWDLESWTMMASRSLGRNLADADCTPDARFVVGARRDGRILLWDMAQDGIMAEFVGEGSMTVIRISDDGEFVVAGEESGRGHFLRLHQPG